MAKQVALLLALLCCSAAVPVRALGVGDTAPTVEAPFVQGADVAQDLKEKLVVLDVMASWCGPCRDELPLLEALYQKYKARGVVVIGVGIDIKENDLRDFVHNARVTFPVKHDKNFRIAQKLNPSKMPSTYVVDASGRIRHKEEGFSVRGIRSLEAKIQELLAASAQKPAIPVAESSN